MNTLRNVTVSAFYAFLWSIVIGALSSRLYVSQQPQGTVTRFQATKVSSITMSMSVPFLFAIKLALMVKRQQDEEDAVSQQLDDLLDGKHDDGH